MVEFSKENYHIFIIKIHLYITCIMIITNWPSQKKLEKQRKKKHKNEGNESDFNHTDHPTLITLNPVAQFI
jgi:hypothetical protein